jgi:hypothetical protein
MERGGSRTKIADSMIKMHEQTDEAACQKNGGGNADAELSRTRARLTLGLRF